MTSDRWEEINRLYNAAVEMEEKERTTFLEKACEGDPELRREVESLLAYDQQAQQFINRPALQLTAEKIAAEPPSLVGRQLGPYQILGVLGAGGMGEVFTARDTRLNRTVAIKVLPRHLLERSDLRQRFEREARAIASLDHPHICALYDIGREGATDFLVMQYLEGETLSQRLRKGPLPTAEVVRYAIEIAGALEQAHRKGVVHRDLKPGNIMLTETGAKLLDFGLAKRAGGAGAPRTLIGAEEGSGTLSNARGSARSTQSKSITEEGMILGTLEYMAPEQLEAKEADARTDLFALGVVIYEMATGQKAFQAESKASLIAKILTAQPPPIGTIQPVSPPELDRVVQRCLAKKPEERWQSAAELTSHLQEIAEANLEILKAQKRGKEPSGQAKEIEAKAEPASPGAILETPKVFSRLIRSRAWKLSFVGIVLAVITGSVALWQVRPQPKRTAEKLKEMSFRPLTSYGWDSPIDVPAISPDGKCLAFWMKEKQFMQVVQTGERRALALPEWFNPTGASWFPDGTKLLLCRAGEGGKLFDFSLWSMSILGGDPRKVVDHAQSPSISPDGSLIAFDRFESERRTIWVVGSNGDSPRRVRASPQPNEELFRPVWSPNGQRLFYRRSDDKYHAIESCDLAGENVTTIFSTKNDNSMRWDLCWVADGRLIFPMAEAGPRAGIFNLWEIKVDGVTGAPLSEARRLTQWSGFSFSNVAFLSITADGKQLTLLKANAQADIYVAEVEPGGKALKNPRPLTEELSDDFVWDWTADSRAIFFASDRNGNRDIFKQDINQMEAETIIASPEHEGHPSLSPDRAFVLYLVSKTRDAPATRLMRVPVSSGPTEPVLTGEKIKNFCCARDAKMCVVVEEVNGKQILTKFDPLKGRGERLPASDYPDFGGGILVLSPQGRLIEKMKPGPAGLYIRVRSLAGGAAEEITFKNLMGDYGFLGWSLDGKGMYLWNLRSLIFKAFYAGLDRHSQVFWKVGTSPGYSLDHPIPSPDGRHLAFTVMRYEANAWMLENF